MLILTRCPSESIMVGNNVTIKVLSVKGHQVRLGIQAPKSIQVHREEVYERIRAERNEEADQDADQNLTSMETVD